MKDKYYKIRNRNRYWSPWEDARKCTHHNKFYDPETTAYWCPDCKNYIWTDVEDEVEMRRRLPAVKTDEAIPVSEKLKEKYPAIYIELE